MSGTNFQWARAASPLIRHLVRIGGLKEPALRELTMSVAGGGTDLPDTTADFRK